MKMRAPRLERKHLLGLKALIRLNYSRAVRLVFDSLKIRPDRPTAESTLKIVQLTDILTEADQPLAVSLALMDAYGSDSALMPVNDQRFAFYEQTLSVNLDAKDFPEIAPEKLEPILAPLRAVQQELVRAFEMAQEIDSAEVYKKAVAKQQAALSNQAQAKTGFVN